MTGRIQQTLADLIVRPGVLIGPKSYLMDRIVPVCEHIMLPEKQVTGGRLEMHVQEGAILESPKKKKFFELKREAQPPLQEHTYLIDFRRRDPQNWAHFLNNHLPLFFHITDTLNIARDECVLVLPQDAPDYIKGAAALFGLRVHNTDARLHGREIQFDMTPWTGMRPARAQWVAHPDVRSCIERITATDMGVPKRVFLSRRDTRSVSNAAELEAFLATYGFVTLYPEDVTPTEQFCIFQAASEMVAIHGAGLAPLLYRRHGGLSKLVEILPCGHVTDVYRVMAQQVGCDWIGVRGRLKPEYVDAIYDVEKEFRAFSLDRFEVDIAAVAQALERIGIETGCQE